LKNRFLIPALALLLSVASSVGIAATAVPTLSTLSDYQNQKLAWRDCNDGMQCATLKVPVDYAKITPGKSFSLFVIRHQASKKSARLGSLVVNPGGPGGSGVDYAYGWSSIISKAVSDRYDIVGFDQRGVNLSQPIRCLNDAQEDAFLSSDGKITDKTSLASAIASAKDFANKCAIAAGSKLGHYSTLDGARDMELLRGLLGDAKLNYMGKSYGTYLGTLYANLYPTKVGKMILDGAVDPQETVESAGLDQAKGFELALDSFIASNPSITKAAVSKVLDTLHANPLKTGKRQLTQSLAVTGIASGLYDNQNGWPQLYSALTDLITFKSGAKLLAMADDYNQRDSDGRFLSNQSDLQGVISCLDFADARTVDQMVAGQANFVKVAPIFGPYLAFAGLSCKFWKAPPVVTKDFTPLASVTPILVIGVTRDPATPYKSAVALKKLFSKSVLLSYDGDGHTGHNRGSSCIDSKVDSYLLTGAVPTGPVTCKAANSRTI
jgi:pimeloyl-ACP methyl ester carboxylesterase